MVPFFTVASVWLMIIHPSVVRTLTRSPSPAAHFLALGFTAVVLLTLDINATVSISSSTIYGANGANTTKDGADFINITNGTSITSTVINGNAGADIIDVRTPLFTRSTAGGGSGNDSLAIGNGGGTYNYQLGYRWHRWTLFIGGTNGAINTSSIYGGSASLTGELVMTITIQASITALWSTVVMVLTLIIIEGDINNSTITGAESLQVASLTSTSLTGGAGADTIVATGRVGSSTIDGAAGNDSLSLGSAAVAFITSSVEGGAGNDTINLTGSGVTASIGGGSGDDSIRLNSSTTAVSVSLGAGNDTLWAIGDLFQTTITGDGGNNSLTIANNFVSSSITAATGADSDQWSDQRNSDRWRRY